jgi:hypothetical protein
MLDSFNVQQTLGQAEFVMAIDQATGKCFTLFGENAVGPGRAPGSGPHEIQKVEIDLDNEGDLQRALVAVQRAKGLLATKATEVLV